MKNKLKELDRLCVFILISVVVLSIATALCCIQLHEIKTKKKTLEERASIVYSAMDEAESLVSEAYQNAYREHSDALKEAEEAVDQAIDTAERFKEVAK